MNQPNDQVTLIKSMLSSNQEMLDAKQNELNSINNQPKGTRGLKPKRAVLEAEINLLRQHREDLSSKISKLIEPILNGACRQHYVGVANEYVVFPQIMRSEHRECVFVKADNKCNLAVSVSYCNHEIFSVEFRAAMTKDEVLEYGITQEGKLNKESTDRWRAKVKMMLERPECVAIQKFGMSVSVVKTWRPVDGHAHYEVNASTFTGDASSAEYALACYQMAIRLCREMNDAKIPADIAAYYAEQL